MNFFKIYITNSVYAHCNNSLVYLYVFSILLIPSNTLYYLLEHMDSVKPFNSLENVGNFICHLVLTFRNSECCPKIIRMTSA
jgi:hypothetical protein